MNIQLLKYIRFWLLVSFIPVCLLFNFQALAQVNDPFEGVNRGVYSLNSTLDKYVIKPAAVTYNNAMPAFAQRGVHNFFQNLDDVNVIVNDLLQLKMQNALNDTGRLALNSTVGIVGLFDVASEFGLYKNNEDFGQTLGHWGVKPGAYIVLPFLGTSNVRDTVGLVPDMLLNPVFWLDHRPTRTAFFVVDTVDTRVGYIAAESMISGDEYNFVRNAYMQRREYLVADGEVYDEFDEF